MIFHEKYELLALRGGDHEIALPGREISSGRDVLVHLLAAGYNPDNVEMLAAIDKLPAVHQRRVLDKGDHEGIPYVVTDVLPGTLKLREWLAEAEAQAPPPVKSTAHRGVWKIPAVLEAPPKGAAPVKEPEPVRRPPAQEDMPTAQMPVPRLDLMPPASPAMTATPPPAAPEPGEFTRMLRAEAAPPPVPPAPPPAATQAPLPVAPEPGEFTRMPRAETALPPAPPAAPPAATQAPPPAVPEPGEFTRILRSTAPPAVPPVAPSAPPQAPPQAAPEPGEFTRMFQVQTPPPPTMPGGAQYPIPGPLPAPAQPPRSAAPGEFTRMMQSPLAPEPLRARPAATPPPSVSQFDRMMQAGQFGEAPPPEVRLSGSAAPPPPARPMQASDEFERMFEREPEPAEGLAVPAPPPAPLPQGGAATGAFSRRSVPAAPRETAGPSEFTQMFAARPPALPAKTPAPAPAPAPAPKAEKKSYLPLILILGGLFLLVVVVIVVFALMR